MDKAEVVVSNNVAGRRYEAHVGDRLAGFAEYQLTDELVVFTHTEVDPSFEGRGVGSALARFALDDVAKGTRKALVVCPFINAWMAKHPEYERLRYGARPSQVTD